MAKNWIQSAIRHPGALTAKAKAAGMTMAQFMASPNHNPATMHQIMLARTLQEIGQRRRHTGKKK